MGRYPEEPRWTATFSPARPNKKPIRESWPIIRINPMGKNIPYAPPRLCSALLSPRRGERSCDMPLLLLHHPHFTQTPCTVHPPPPAAFLRRCSIAFQKPPPSRAVPPLLAFRTATVRCMAHPRRVKMVAKQIMRELSDMLLTDTVLQYAILPEAALGADRYLSSVTTVSDVEVSADLQVVKVYISVFGDERGKELALSGLKSKAKYVRSKLGKRMKLRLTPEIRFIEDESLERGSRVIAILDRIKEEKKKTEGQQDDKIESSLLPQDSRGWDSDDPDDEGIIYVN